MQNWEEYEADYYGMPGDRMRDREWMREMPRDWQDRKMCPVDRMGNPMCHGNRPNRKMYSGDWMNRDMYQDNRMSRNVSVDPETARTMRQDSHEVITDEPVRRSVSDEDVWRDMDEFEELYDDLSEAIMEIIRQICDSIDGEGCIAMEGQMTRDVLEMMIDRVMEQMDGGDWMQNDGQMRNDGRMQSDGQMRSGGQMSAGSAEGDDAVAVAAVAADPLTAAQNDWRRSLIRSLLFHELLRRRMRRRMHRRNRGDYRDRGRR